MPRLGPRNEFTPCATVLSASMSRPLSVSSRMAYFGSSMASCRISVRFFSPPEKPSLTAQKVRDCHARDFAWILESQEKPAPGTFIGVELEKIFFFHHHLAPGNLVVGMAGQDL